LLACGAAPHVEQFLVPHPVPPPRWRIDLHPGDVRPLRIASTAEQDPRALCAAPVP